MHLTAIRHWVLVLGDQLDPNNSAFDGFDSARGRILMAEVRAAAAQLRHAARGGAVGA